jgi:RNA polymerase sigma-70 factor (ECF subfamily)
MDNTQLKHLLHRMVHHDDRKAFSVFFDHYHMRLMNLAMLFIQQYDEAEEVVSEVFISLLKKKRDLPDIDHFEGYLFTMVKHQALNHLKSRRKDSGNIPIDDIKDHLSSDYAEPLERLINDDLRTAIARAIHSLPPKRQLVFKMVKDEGMSYKQVADILEISERTVEVHLKLAIQDLRKVLAQYYEEHTKEVPISKLGRMLPVLLIFSF